jgi:lipoprotein-anchoring transpeptidase ErfK/SrfK
VSRFALPAARLGNEFALLQPRVADLLHRSVIISFAILFLLVGAAATRVGGSYWSAQVVNASEPLAIHQPVHQISGLNMTINSNELEARLKTVTTQPATLTVGDQTTTISPEKIRSWLTITHDKKKSVDYVHINAATIAKSLNASAAKYVKAPVNQVTVTRSDGTSEVVVAGRNGTLLVDPAALNTQAQQVAKTVMDGKGMQFTTPLAPLAFQAVTPAAFAKLIEIDVVTKQMYLYDNGTMTHSYPVSAGAPVTPTPIGQFKIYSKLPVQDMKGNNPDGSKYLQPHVRWINYFLPGGYAVHGNYWRPASVFGFVNTSHGCVSLPEAQAKQVYDWAPIGTTVITHY